MKKKGFTLIEAVVCIAIFSLLMSLLWPLLSNVMSHRKWAYEMAQLETHLRNVTESIMAGQDPNNYLALIEDPHRYQMTVTTSGEWVLVELTDTVLEESLRYEIYP